MLGDLLRFAAFSAISDSERRKEQFSLFCEKAHLSPEQAQFGDVFLEMHSALLSNKIDEAKNIHSELTTMLSRDDDYMRYFMKTVYEELFEKQVRAVAGFMSKMKNLGRDYDTYAYLAGLLLPEGGYDSTDFRPMLPLVADNTLQLMFSYFFREVMPEVSLGGRDNVLANFYAGEFSARECLGNLRKSANHIELESKLEEYRELRE